MMNESALIKLFRPDLFGLREKSQAYRAMSLRDRNARKLISRQVFGANPPRRIANGTSPYDHNGMNESFGDRAPIGERVAEEYEREDAKQSPYL